MRGLTRLLPALALALVLGCGKGKVTVYPVTGQVVYNGKPASGVRVFLLPVSAPTVPAIPSNPRAVTESDGRFTLTTFADGDGAAEGGYQVVLLWPPEGPEGDEEHDSDRLFGWYDGAHSTLKAQVQAGENVLPAFKLPAVSGPPAISEGIPGRN